MKAIHGGKTKNDKSDSHKIAALLRTVPGIGGNKIGNMHVKWAFSEAAVLFLGNNPEAMKFIYLFGKMPNVAGE
jgi:hypothetical protein